MFFWLAQSNLSLSLIRCTRGYRANWMSFQKEWLSRLAGQTSVTPRWRNITLTRNQMLCLIRADIHHLCLIWLSSEMVGEKGKKKKKDAVKAAPMQPRMGISQGRVKCLRSQQIQWAVEMLNYFSLTFCKMAAVIIRSEHVPSYYVKRIWWLYITEGILKMQFKHRMFRLHWTPHKST